MKKKDVLFIFIGIILVFSLGFLSRGILSEESKVDEEKLRTEIRSEIEAEIDALMIERMKIIVPDGIIIKEHEGLGGTVVSVNDQARTIEIQIMNRLHLFTGGSLVEFLSQPHYFIKTVLVTNETEIEMFIGEGKTNSVFQEIKQGQRIFVFTDQPFKMGTAETLTAERIAIAPAF